MRKKPVRTSQKRPVSVNPLMNKFFQKAGVSTVKSKVQSVRIQGQEPSSNPQTAKQRYIELVKLWQTQGVAQALSLGLKAAAEFPKDGNILNLTGVLLAQSGRIAEALELWLKIDDTQKNASTYSNIGQAYQTLNQLDLSEQNLRRALQLQADNKDALWNLAVLLQRDENRIDEAIENYKKVLAVEPDSLKTLLNIAALYFNRKEYRDAEIYYDQIVALDQNNVTAWQNGAWSKRRLENYRGAVRYYEQAVKLDPHNADLWFGLGKCYHFTLQFDKACEACEQGLKIKPDDIDAQVSLVLNRQYVLNQAEQTARDSFRLGETYVKQAVHAVQRLAKAKERLHIGVVSSDLRRHPVGLFARGLLMSEEAKQFDWTAYANSDVFDEVSEQIRPTFKAWHKIKALSDEEVIKQIEQDEIDILLDLNGLTAGHRLAIFAAQSAPVQVTWLGYFATSGLPTMQAIIADPYCVPSEEEKWYSEKVYRLPHTRLCMNYPGTEAQVNLSPALEKGYITFGCFQNLTKVNDDVLKLWAEVAKKVPSAHWRFQAARLSTDSEDLPDFKQKLTKLGFPMNQVEFFGTTHFSEYFPTYNKIDLILDTFPYPGGTTTVDALWMGVPTITLALPSMLSRQGQQVLSAAGFADLVTYSPQQYVEKALYWADSANRNLLNQMRLTMREKARNSPLFNTAQFSKDWCTLIQQIWQDAVEQNKA
ncbi:putative O-linked N-acetylglucosamine transferase (SPINDLY family) [Cricetibacter osteomyelitidis]|uniref:protein O-GlcNAc transferase n=1 Tax=Cricetibacter osteomyelitidis TaxID=1521931 RepID=A0A4R2TI09_9PAST|nr:tetratricopeptide repeat protein [Cricetibacter osteomyelitidis]TCP96858.1 putative O-linked N-acetylglucosamine transferase (SPINDLY family) [Cricetibacter osteomyelitidis]